jgi:hypothetical protein
MVMPHDLFATIMRRTTPSLRSVEARAGADGPRVRMLDPDPRRRERA